MYLYRVTWEIDVEADTPHEAAEKTREIQERREGIAHVYDVQQWEGPNGQFLGETRRFDLDEEEGKV